MASHASALGITALGYHLARRHVSNPKFSFGTGKIGDLAGFSSALLLAFIALLMIYESVTRLYAPVAISFDEAITVAVLGLIVNLAEEIKRLVKSEGDNQIVDLHLWRVGPGHFAAVISLLSGNLHPPSHYKEHLSGFRELRHITVEINPKE
jgi:Co/Zn/Cd efflux system component